jgi:5-methylcytosine-specific restriction protein B
MAPQPVEAVFFFRYTQQVYQASYARISASTRYTKNYIQVSGQPAHVLDQVFGRSGNQRVALNFVWPTGSEEGGLRPHGGQEQALRLDLYWPESGRAPKPWKIGSFDDPEITIPGDPSRTDEAGADAEREKLEKANLGPWLLAVKLIDDGPRLHTRAYLERPPAGREQTGLNVLPAQVLGAIHQLPAGTQSGFLRFHGGSLPPKLRAKAIVDRILEALEEDPNVLLVGPPGTGKTVALEDLRALVEQPTGSVTFDPTRWHDAFVEDAAESKAISLVFHPSYAYENFVAGLIPYTDEEGLKLIAQPGPLVSLAQWTAASDRQALLLIDEFNRGPTAAIFGDTLALLDAEKRENISMGQPGAHITRPYVGTQMLVPPEYADVNGERQVPDELRLPSRVRIVAALNSSDRSVAPLDAALRRRFAILRVSPDVGVLAAHFAVAAVTPTDSFDPSSSDPDAWTDEDVKRLALHLLLRLNERIAAVLSEDFLLGHALFWPVGNAPTGLVGAALCRAFDQRVTASLRITFTDQDDLLAAVLGAGTPEAPTGARSIAIWREPPPSVAGVATPYLELRATASMPWRGAADALRFVVS